MLRQHRRTCVGVVVGDSGGQARRYGAKPLQVVPPQATAVFHDNCGERKACWTHIDTAVPGLCFPGPVTAYGMSVCASEAVATLVMVCCAYHVLRLVLESIVSLHGAVHLTET